MARNTATLRGRAPFAIILGAIAAILLLPGVALAHATLESTDPPAGAVLDSPPSTITLKFSEPVETGLGGVRLFDGKGNPVDVGAPQHPSGQSSVVTVSVPQQLANGSYVVDWRVVSADSHPVAGAYTFQVGSVADLQPGVIDQIVSRDQTSRSASIALGITRGLVIAAIALVFGGLFAMAVGIVDASARNRRIVLIAAVVGGIVGLLQLPLEVGYATNRSLNVVFDPDAWSSALDTRVGTAWFIRALLIGVAGVLLVLTIARRHDFWWRALFAAALLGAGVASAFSGHGATGRWHAVGIIATVVHVAAMAVWLGGLLMVLVGVGKLTVGRLRLFSTVAVGAMLLIVASGVVQAIRQVESLDALTNTNYGTLLLWKVGFVVAVLIVAAISRRIVWRQQLDRPRLIRTVAIEVVLAVAVVSVTAVLMGANPSQAVQSGPFSAQLVNQGYIASITIEPARVGGNIMHLYLSNPQSSLVEPDDVQVQISDPSREVAPLDVTMVRSGASHYSSTDLVFPYSATWVLTVNTRYNTFDSVQFTTNVPIP